MACPLNAHDKLTRELSKGIYQFGIPKALNQEIAPVAIEQNAQEIPQ